MLEIKGMIEAKTKPKTRKVLRSLAEAFCIIRDRNGADR